VERNVRSSVAKLPAFVIASLAWLAIPASRSSSRVATSDSTATASAPSPWSRGIRAIACAGATPCTPSVRPIRAASCSAITNGSEVVANGATTSGASTQPWRLAYAEPPAVARQTSPPSVVGSQTEQRVDPMILAAPSATCSSTPSRLVTAESSRVSSSSAFALSASRRCAS